MEETRRTEEAIEVLDEGREETAELNSCCTSAQSRS